MRGMLEHRPYRALSANDRAAFYLLYIFNHDVRPDAALGVSGTA
jgi:hypothetical protein